MLGMMRFKGNVENFAEDAAGNILIQESSALHMLGNHGSITEFDSINHRPIKGCHTISRSLDGHFLVQERDYSSSPLPPDQFTALFQDMPFNSGDETVLILRHLSPSRLSSGAMVTSRAVSDR